jgi:hypothetical protein
MENEITINSETNKSSINFNLSSFGGLLNNKNTLGSHLRNLYKKEPLENDFLQLLEAAFEKIKDKINEELNNKNKITIVTTNGKETFYSDILEKFLREKLILSH